MHTPTTTAVFGTVAQSTLVRLCRVAAFAAVGMGVAPWATAQARVELNTWFSATRGDHLASSDPRWRGATDEVRPVGEGSGYVRVRNEGMLFSPDRPAPRGTIPLYSFWNAERGDNFVSSDPAWTASASRDGYVRVRLEGYLYATARSGTVPLRSFWSASRQDNHATTDPRLAVRVGDEVGERSMSVEGGRYKHYRIEGYMSPSTTTVTARPRLRGLVDMHTHLMGHLGFGRKLLHGAPDAGSLLPAGTRDCNRADRPAAGIADALGHDNSTHGGHDFLNNDCGDYVRPMFLSMFESENGAQSQHGASKGGYPDFDHWPRHNDITHQQMWVDWIRRAHANGLRVMVTLAVHSRTIATVTKGDPPFDDRTSADVQLRETVSFIGRHSDFMALATSAAQLRRIVASGRLAVVLGVELDDLGNFQSAPLESVTREAIEAEVARLWRLGVRYVFPVHLADNPFGGTATYEPFFGVMNRLQTGAWWDLECSSTVGWQFEPDAALTWALGHIAGLGLPAPRPCPAGQGNRNRRDLTPEGRELMQAMMRRGMLVDIDHMSERTADSVIALARDYPSGWGYPLVSGHNGPRGAGGSERALRIDQLEAIRDRGGLLGLGWAKQNAASFHGNLREAHALMGPGRVAFGTDTNGISPLPGPPGTTSVSMPWRTGNRVWDYRELGVAQYGMIAEFVQDLRNIEAHALPPDRASVDGLFDAAESFARTWERAELAARVALPPAPSDPSVRVFTPASTGWMCPTDVVAGDREFDGHGPEIWASAQLELRPDRGLDAILTLRARETTSDWSETRGTWRVPVSPPAMRVAEVLSDQRSETHVISSSAGFQLVAPGPVGNVVSTPPIEGGSLVRGFEIVGDTGGPDISTDGDCGDDTRMRVVFRPVRVRVTP